MSAIRRVRDGLSLGLAGLTALAGCRRSSASHDAFDGGPTIAPHLNTAPDLALCRKDAAFASSSVPLWDGSADIEVRFIGRAGEACPGPGFPFVEARLPDRQGWIQIVEINVPVPSGEGRPTMRLYGPRASWVFLDMEERLRDGGLPFVNDSTDGRFWDNPVWSDPPAANQADGDRVWQGRSYAVTSQGATVVGVAGLSWGYGWKVGTSAPYPIEPRALDRAAWVEDAQRLSRAMQGWTFR